MFHRSAASWWRVALRPIMFGAIVAVLAAVVLQHAAPVRQGERAAAALNATVAAELRLAATTVCKETGVIPSSAIDRTWLVKDADEIGNLYAYKDADPTQGVVLYSNAVHGVSITAQADGDCAQHGRRLGGLSPWLAYTIGSGLGVSVRLGVLAILVSYAVPVVYARALSEAAGGFVAGVMNNWFSKGKFTAGAFAAGLFGAIAAVTGGHLSRLIIGRLTPLPTRAADVVRTLSSTGVAMSGAGSYAASALASAQNDWDDTINEFLRQHPDLPAN